METELRKEASKVWCLAMSIDNLAASRDNFRFVFPQPQASKVEIHESLGSMAVLVLDFDVLGIEQCTTILKSSSEPCMFVVWYPWRNSPADVVRLHQELVGSGATLIEKQSEHQSFLECWSERKRELDERIRRRQARIAAKSTVQKAAAARSNS